MGTHNIYCSLYCPSEPLSPSAELSDNPAVSVPVSAPSFLWVTQKTQLPILHGHPQLQTPPHTLLLSEVCALLEYICLPAEIKLD